LIITIPYNMNKPNHGKIMFNIQLSLQRLKRQNHMIKIRATRERNDIFAEFYQKRI